MCVFLTLKWMILQVLYCGNHFILTLGNLNEHPYLLMIRPAYDQIA